MSRKIKILVLGSLLLNVLLIGVSLGHVSHRLGNDRFNRRPVPEFVAQLPEDKEKLFFETMERVRSENRDIYRQIKEARERSISILTAPEFDEDAYQAEIGKLHELYGLMKQRLANATIGLAKQFNQEERKALANYLRRPPSPPPGAKPNPGRPEVSRPQE